jgi:diguanylate cyclase (GGDEF)-like protein/PAS domain S-box-containing protein
MGMRAPSTSDLLAVTRRDKGFMRSTGDHGAWEWDLATQAICWSENLYRIHGVLPADYTPTVDTIRVMIHPEDRISYREAVETAIAKGTPFMVQHRIVRPNGMERTLLVRGSRLLGPDGGPGRLMGTTQDVTGREGMEERLWHYANEDPLTKLSNRRRFSDDLSHEIAVARRTRRPGVVVMLDLDRFKEVNDTLGHQSGDSLLVRVAHVLKDCLRATDRLARQGGDEFVLLLPRCPVPEARKVVARVLHRLAEEVPVQIAGRDRTVTASAGVAGFTGDEESADEVLVAADLAMYRAKRSGGNRVASFDHEMRAELAARVRIEAELRDALELEQINPHYQTIVSVADGAAVGVEALARWEHPERGLIPPAEFIPIAEEQGVIGDLGRRMLREACRDAHEWRLGGDRAFVSVNISPVELMREDVPRAVEEALDASGLPAALLQIEVTENFLIDDTAQIRPVLARLKRLGVRLAIDDFGGGTSSLSSLSALPLDVIKIDRSFIKALDRRGEDHAIVTAVISLAEELELEVVAEGVETERQHSMLRELGCPFAQGYLYSKPIPKEKLQLSGYTAAMQPGFGDPSVIREFMRQIGIPARIDS